MISLKINILLIYLLENIIVTILCYLCTTSISNSYLLKTFTNKNTEKNIKNKLTFFPKVLIKQLMFRKIFLCFENLYLINLSLYYKTLHLKNLSTSSENLCFKNLWEIYPSMT